MASLAAMFFFLRFSKFVRFRSAVVGDIPRGLSPVHHRQKNGYTLWDERTVMKIEMDVVGWRHGVVSGGVNWGKRNLSSMQNERDSTNCLCTWLTSTMRRLLLS